MKRNLLTSATLGFALACSQPASAQARTAVTFDQQISAARKAMMGDPQQALRLADAALATARALPESKQARLSVATAQWLSAEAHISLNDVAAAMPMIDGALKTVDELAPMTKLQGDLLRARGAALATGGHLADALDFFQRAYKVFVVVDEPRSQAIELQDIGSVFDSAGDYQRALGYYAQAIEAYQRDPALLLANYNNRAEALRKLHRPAEAERDYVAALREADQLASAVLRIRVLCNLADLRGERGAFQLAHSALARAEQLARSGEGREWLPFVLGTRGKVALAAGDFKEAGALFGRMFAGGALDKTDASYLEFHDAASRTYDRLGRSDLALRHLRAYQRLDAGARTLIASASAQLAASRFDFTTQNLRIANLKAAQLRQQVQIERQHARIRTVVTAALLAIAVGIVGFLSFALITGRKSRDRLRTINGDLENALRAKTDFLAMTSHEIRTPLNGILGMTQVMMTADDLNPQHRDRLRLVHGAGETMKALVDDILDVAKMETSTIEVVEEDVDVGSLLGDVAALWRDQAEAKDIALLPVAGNLPPLVRTDQARLRQIVFNLLSNAVKFTLQGRIEVRATISDVDEETRLVVEVADTGIGIDASQLEAIFEPFHQADAATTRRFGGTGLGLAICRKVAAAMGGSVTVSSEPDVGSTFTLLLPVVRSCAASDRRPVSDLSEARIHLVAGNMLTQAVLAGLIEPAVAEVRPHANLAGALAAAEAEPADHAVIDASSVTFGGDGTPTLDTYVRAATSLGMRVTVLVPASDERLSDLLAIEGLQLAMKPIAGSALISRLSELYGLGGPMSHGIAA